MEAVSTPRPSQKIQARYFDLSRLCLSCSLPSLQKTDRDSRCLFLANARKLSEVVEEVFSGSNQKGPERKYTYPYDYGLFQELSARILRKYLAHLCHLPNP